MATDDKKPKNEKTPPPDQTPEQPPIEPSTTPPEDPGQANEPPPPVEPGPEPAAFLFKPRHDGEYLYGVPARDLSQREYDHLDPALQLSATAPGPDGTPLYHPVEKPSDK